MVDIYQKINGADYRRIFVVGDIHGCLGMLNEKLLSVDFDESKDLLISVGDLIDRGSQNVECLDLITQPWFRAVRGNHEQMAIDALNGSGDVNNWIANGGMWFFCLDYDQEVLTRALIAMAEKLPLVIEVDTDSGKYVIAHADYPSDSYHFGKPVSEQHVIWNRERVRYALGGKGEEIAGAKQFIFGHTPMSKAGQFKNQLYIDTGAVFGRHLTMIKIQGE
ncbi:TPA: metallophosphoesterase [Yersinia enterocolitica]|uniref:metallophosphoesterase n=1 Tax=Yersinia enterocolitica TaxID=630 RepID=UPI0032F2B059|nr:metallophosphoesterase [Yersinia enterocolitica]HDL6972908.1 metallophosphoesterase [Yersinia enterocolitica]HDL6976068.1 metallophosphoesterase [Yersinia enterocolitica]HDL6998151.1 metallophosphoesterase [Yersinia enterocolitica]HDL7097152.1 metallophosphoesterase [Yersinia enterocolitica]